MLSPPAVAEAANTANFDPGYIISDANFYNANAMSEAEIQSFLNTKIGTCSNAKCLNVLTQSTYSRPADRTVCGAYSGAENEPASRVIFKVQQACGISAKVILVTLQKEMALVTSKSPSDWSLAHALGYACSDSSPCDSAQAGFYNQIYMAAWQFKRYSTPDIFGGFWAGQTRSIQYNRDTSCGGLTVTISNRATAALYNYTPYTPNAAAFAAYPGSTDKCGAYGNRNFWFFYSDWFGSPTGQINPIGNFDAVWSPQGSTIGIAGWALDFDTPDSLSIHVYVDGTFNASVLANVARADVNTAYPGMPGNYGFSTTLPVAPGTRNVCVYAINVGPGTVNTPLGCRTVKVASPPPVEPAATESGAVYRFWSDTYQGHFYTRSVAERNNVIMNYPDSVWKYEGPMFGAYGAQVDGTVPVYRFWSATYKGHFYTASEAEKNQVIADYPDQIWQYEMVAFYVYPNSSSVPGTVPVARFWSPTYHHHFYTANAAEAQQVAGQYSDQIWTPEGDVFRVLAAPSAAPLP